MSTGGTQESVPDRGLTRRALVVNGAKLGTAAAAAVWVAPKLESVAFAAGTQGSEPTTTTGTGSTSSTEETGPTCQVDPNEILRHGTTHLRGARWQPSSTVVVTIIGQPAHWATITTNAAGSFDVVAEAPNELALGSYRVEFNGYDSNGVRRHCVETLVISDHITTQGSTTTSGGNSGNNTGSSNGGTLPFTGGDTGALVAVGAGALVVGRLLYALRERLATPDGSPRGNGH